MMMVIIDIFGHRHIALARSQHKDSAENDSRLVTCRSARTQTPECLDFRRRSRASMQKSSDGFAMNPDRLRRMHVSV